MPYGFQGKILRVDLSVRRISTEEPGESFYRRYLGGMGVIGYYLLKEVAPGTEPLSPDNKLIFAPSVITGAPFSGSGRNGVGAKSPMTDAYGKSEVGGFWGAELKHAGFDALIVEGEAEAPVYLWVHDGEAEIRPASHLWGLHTREAQETIRQEVGDRLARVAQIGPGGENLVRFACVINDLRDAAGRTGMGAVMGSKRLKAIAVRGKAGLRVADRQKVQDLAKWMGTKAPELAYSFHTYGTGAAMVAFNLQGNLPTRNFRDGFFPEVDQISAPTLKETIGIGMESCYACAVRCKKVVSVTEPYRADPAYGGPEYETLASLGSNCGVSDPKALARAHHLCHAYGLDTISTGGTIAFAMECFEAGLLTERDTGDIQLTFGNAPAMLQAIELIAHRRGIGALLAEGSKRAAEQIGGGAEDLAMQVKGVEMGMHEPRLKQGLGLGYCVAPQGGDHGTGLHDTAFVKEGPDLEAAKPFGILEPMPATELSDRKARLFTYLHTWRNAQDALCICYFVPWSVEQTRQLVAAVTGWETSVWELMKVGERAATMARAFNLREGLSSKDDVLPRRFFRGTAQGALQDTAVDPRRLDDARTLFYELMGWDRETGVPTAGKLAELDIPWVAEEIRRGGVRAPHGQVIATGVGT